MSAAIENAELLVDVHTYASHGERVLVICYDATRAQQVATQAAIAWKEPYTKSNGWMAVGTGHVGFVGLGSLSIGAVRGQRLDRWVTCDGVTLEPALAMTLQGQLTQEGIARVAAEALRERMKETDDQAFARQLREMRGEPEKPRPTPAEIARVLDGIAATGIPLTKVKVDPALRTFWDPVGNVEFVAASEEPYPAPGEKLR